MSELSTHLEAHHILWIRKLWEIKPYDKLRNHKNAIIKLTNAIHHGELHPMFMWRPMPLPPLWAVDGLYRALEKATGPINGIECMIEYLKSVKKSFPKDKKVLKKYLRSSALDREDIFRVENLLHSLQDQLDFLRSKNITD